MSRWGQMFRWSGFVISLVATALAGQQVSFNVYAIALKNTFNFTMTQVEIVSSLGLIGYALTFLQTIITGRFGYKTCYIVILLLSPPSCGLFFVAVIYKKYFHDRAVLLGCFQFIGTVGNGMLRILVTQIAVDNFDKRHIGKIIGVYSAVNEAGKILYATIYQLFFLQDLGRFFMTIGLIWIVIYGLCFYLHRPDFLTEEKQPIMSDEMQQDTHPGLDHLEPDNTERRISFRNMVTSVYFHVMFWSALIFSAMCVTFMDNLTAIGESTGFNEPVVLVYIFTICILASRIFCGVVYDYFATDTCGFVMLFTCYALFITSMSIGLSQFDKIGVVAMAVLIGLSFPATSMLSVAMMTSRYGRGHFSAIMGAYFACVSVLATVVHIIFGQFYDKATNTDHTESVPCKGPSCFFWVFIMFLGTSGIIALVQIIYVSAKCFTETNSTANK